MNYQKIPQFTDCGSYHVNVCWAYLEETIHRYTMDTGFDMDPDFQRGHVWTEAQQIAYVEFILKGGRTGRDILTNCPNWQRGKIGTMVLVDGKQRIQAVQNFMTDQLKVFGHYKREITGHLPRNCDFLWHVNDLPHRHQVLKWYLELNSGGTPHTADEIERVRALLQEEEKHGQRNKP